MPVCPSGMTTTGSDDRPFQQVGDLVRGHVIAILLVMDLLVAGCADAPGEQAPTEQTPTPQEVEPGADPSPTAEPSLAPADTEAAAPEATSTLSGTFGGDPALEGGCTWLDAEDGRYEIVYPDDYEVTADPPRITGPDGKVIAEDGDSIVLEGYAEPDLTSICQVGPIWRALEIHPV